MGKSLLDDAGFDSIGKKKAVSGGSGRRNDGVKLGVAALAIVAAAGFLVWHYDLLGYRAAGVRKAAAPTAERQEQFNKQEADRKAEEELNPDQLKGQS